MKASTLACGYLHQNLQMAKQYWIYPQTLLFVSNDGYKRIMQIMQVLGLPVGIPLL